MEINTTSISAVLEHLTLKRAELVGRLKEIDTVIALLSATDKRREKPRPAGDRDIRPPKKQDHRRPKTIQEIIGTTIIEFMEAHGGVTASELKRLKNTEYTGPIISGWKRSMLRSGIHLDEMIECVKNDQGENRYSLTNTGRLMVRKAENGRPQQPENDDRITPA